MSSNTFFTGPLDWTPANLQPVLIFHHILNSNRDCNCFKLQILETGALIVTKCLYLKIFSYEIICNFSFLISWNFVEILWNWLCTVFLNCQFFKFKHSKVNIDRFNFFSILIIWAQRSPANNEITMHLGEHMLRLETWVKSLPSENEWSLPWTYLPV